MKNEKEHSSGWQLPSYKSVHWTTKILNNSTITCACIHDPISNFQKSYLPKLLVKNNNINTETQMYIHKHSIQINHPHNIYTLKPHKCV